MTTLAPTLQQTGVGPRRWVTVAYWNLSRALIITRREVVDMFRDWRIIVPILILTMIFPYIANWGAARMVAFVDQYGADIIGERLVPFLLMVVGFFPSSFALIIALESFVGEKERHSLEPLLATPLTDTQLYIGKMLSSTLPPLVGSLIGITVYLLGVYQTIQWTAPPVLLIQILLLTAMQALVMVTGAVVVSSQSTSVRAANLLASFIIIPMSFLIQAEAFIMFMANYDILWLFLVGLVVVTVLLIRMGVHTFNREELLGRELDELNLIGIAKNWFRLTVARRVGGTRRNAWQWYRDEVLKTIWRMRLEVVILFAAMAVAYYIGVRYVETYPIPAELFHTDEFGERFQEVLAETGLSGVSGILFVLFQNVRVLAAASALAVFSFGVLVIILLMLPIVIVGFLLTQMLAAGIDPLTAFAAVVPHSLLEVPAAILAGAAALRLGACVIAPPPGRTVGQAWMEALADASRLWFTLILPLIVLAAVVEIYVTPSLVTVLAGGG